MTLRKTASLFAVVLFVIFLSGHAVLASAAQEPLGMPGMPGMAAGNRATDFLFTQSSGTSTQPRSWPMPSLMGDTYGWNLMWMGQVFLNATQQSGPRGGDKLFSTNWGMFGAARPLGGGGVMLRGMISLEPITVTERRYPLLFQTGEQAFGQPIVDGQHPHDLFMEIAGEYARPVGESGMLTLYYGALGAPALGPTAFPHRASAAELPQAPLSHHWQDSTHIATNVVTAGFGTGPFRIEASGFHGMEPDENRWNIDWGRIDSWASRLTVSPADNWSGQFSVGRLDHPEPGHNDAPHDIVRLTGSVQHIRPIADGRAIASTLAWGQNRNRIEAPTNAVLAETVVPFAGGNYLTGRIEWSQRDELFVNDPEDIGPSGVFDVTAATAGYTREVITNFLGSIAVGGNITRYWIAPGLQDHYGESPWGAMAFIRLRLGRAF